MNRVRKNINFLRDRQQPTLTQKRQNRRVRSFKRSNPPNMTCERCGLFTLHYVLYYVNGRLIIIQLSVRFKRPPSVS